MTLVQAIYENGVFRPLEPVLLPEAASVNLAVEHIAAGKTGAGFLRCAGALTDSWTEDDVEILRQIAADRKVVSEHRQPIVND